MYPDVENSLDQILQYAIQSKTSDVHFEPQRDYFVVRLRIDGILRTYQTLDKNFHDTIISKIKVLSSMNIAEHRIPQDGHYEYKYFDKTYNIRASSLPTIYGEAIVLRILNSDSILINLEALGFTANQLEIVYKLVANTSGLILTTGPTGSGKTNLLYSLLHARNKPEVNIITLEDPVEYEIASVRQTQINEAIGITFAKAMRTVVRQDPNIIMVGEIRDAETAQTVIQASLTGVLVFSTFHTFDIPALISRLLEMGATNAVLAQAIVGVISARLIRTICDSCTTPYSQEDFAKLPEFLKKSLDLSTIAPTMRKGKGCEACQKTGYKGRTGIYEIVDFDNELKAAITEKKPSSFIYELLTKRNTQSLVQIAKEKIAKGITTPEEITRVLGVTAA